jgi:glycosyltransferase involved in cell wall biosynthesis
MNFSILVCTRNGKKRISTAIDSILNLRVNDEVKYELIIVDNASNDDLEELLRDKYNHSNLTYVTEENIGRINALKQGVALAKYDFILTCDDDNELDTNYLINASSVLKNNNISILGGESYFSHDVKNFPKWFENNMTHFAIGNRGFGKLNGENIQTDWIWGAGMIIKKSILFYLFDNNLLLFGGRNHFNYYIGGEDIEICKLSMHYLGSGTYFNSSLKLKHHIDLDRINWVEFKNLVVRNGMPWFFLDMYKVLVFSNSSLTVNSLRFYLFIKYFNTVLTFYFLLIPKLILKNICNFNKDYYSFELQILEAKLIFRYCRGINNNIDYWHSRFIHLRRFSQNISK